MLNMLIFWLFILMNWTKHFRFWYLFLRILLKGIGLHILRKHVFIRRTWLSWNWIIFWCIWLLFLNSNNFLVWSYFFFIYFRLMYGLIRNIMYIRSNNFLFWWQLIRVNRLRMLYIIMRSMNSVYRCMNMYRFMYRCRRRYLYRRLCRCIRHKCRSWCRCRNVHRLSWRWTINRWIINMLGKIYKMPYSLSWINNIILQVLSHFTYYCFDRVFNIIKLIAYFIWIIKLVIWSS